MSKIVSLLFLVSSLFSSENYFLDEGGALRPQLIRLLQLDGLYEEGDGLEEAVKKTQDHWVGVIRGQGGIERVDLIDPPEWSAIKPDVLKCLEEMGIAQGKKPSLKKYDYAFLFGAFVKGMRYRLQELVDAWENGIRFDELVVLTGERPLRKVEPDEFFDRVETEREAAELLIKEMSLPFNCKVTFVSAKMEGGLRPTLADALRAWLTTSPKGGIILAPSHPIIFVHQDLVAKNILPYGFLIETTAKLATDTGKGYTSLIFDTIAKSLYEINTNR